MRLMKSVLMAALIAAPAMTFAQAPAPAAQKPALVQREFNQHRRIQNGVRNGQLNHRQAFRLERQQRSIHRQMRVMRTRHNGRLTPRDRRILNHRMNVASRRIYRAKHNG
jgi:Spy/CpxP family protein refolding chaperone